MLDYQINENIARAYLESVCGMGKGRAFKNNCCINESDKKITPELIEKRNRRRMKKGKKTVSYERELKRERRRHKPSMAADIASEAGKGFVRASNIAARDLAHTVPATMALFGNTEKAKEIGDDINKWFNPIIYRDYGSDAGDSVSAQSEFGGKVGSLALPAAGFAKILKGMQGANLLKNAWLGLNTLDKANKGKLAAQAAAGIIGSRAIEGGIEKGAENLKKAGYEGESELLSELGGFAPWAVTPVGSTLRYVGSPVADYGQRKFGNEESKPYVNDFKKHVLGTYEGTDDENGNKGNNIDSSGKEKEPNETGGENNMGNAINLKCPRCEFTCKDKNEMKQHLRSTHALIWNEPPQN